MITLNAKINLLGGSNGSVADLSTNISGSNISIPISSVINNDSNGGNHFIIGANKVGDTATIVDEIDYFSGSQLADYNGEFPNPYLIRIKSNSSKPQNLKVKFDTVNNRYPSKVILSQIGTESFTENESFSLQDDDNDGIYEDSGEILLPSNITKMISVDAYVLPDADYQEFSGSASAEYIEETNTINWHVSNNMVTDHSSMEIYIVYEGYVNNQEYTDDDSVYILENISWGNSNEIILIIDNWNTPYFPLILQNITGNVNIDVNKRNIISIDVQNAKQGDVKLPSFGIISNGGNIAFKDTNGEINELAEEGYLDGGLEVDIYILNTITKRMESVAHLITNEWDYDNNTREVSVSVKDDLEQWQDISVSGFEYDPDNPYKIVDGTMADIYRWLYTKTPSKYKMLSYDELNADVKTVLTETTINYPFLSQGSLWQQWAKLCTVCGLCIFKNRNGRTYCAMGE